MSLCCPAVDASAAAAAAAAAAPPSLVGRVARSVLPCIEGGGRISIGRAASGMQGNGWQGQGAGARWIDLVSRVVLDVVYEAVLLARCEIEVLRGCSQTTLASVSDHHAYGCMCTGPGPKNQEASIFSFISATLTQTRTYAHRRHTYSCISHFNGQRGDNAVNAASI